MKTTIQSIHPLERLILQLFCFLFFIFYISSCKDDENKSIDPDALTLNGAAFKPNEFSAIRSLNQLVIISKDNRITTHLVIYKGDTGVFTIKPNDPGMKKGEASAQLAIDGQVYYAQSGTVTIHKQGENTYRGEYAFESVSLDEGWVQLKNGRFKDVLATSVNYGTVEDYEGNIYKTVKIGTQTWMAENLRSTRYSNGDVIPNTRIYNDVDTLAAHYGRLYTWSAAMHGSTMEMAQGACPSGWHVPSNAESNLLIESSGGALKAGSNLKASVTWYDNYGFSSFSSMADISNNNSTGFTALASGLYSFLNGYYESFGFYGYFWNSTSAPGGLVGFTAFSYYSGSAFTYNLLKEHHACPVRCIKNE